ncbi:gliding motility lipoprotein GldH [Pedobacter sp. SYSU D00535]|uniref:gliding motility lipoprotein GldH n=1 Tax=Pedobacter sp. SYSU D00535 TaxID=2810308 RepID=UPI001A973D35|nr:gliding motility lipoprotein GldH [Pedobacter sp. SYSU D00535]
MKNKLFAFNTFILTCLLAAGLSSCKDNAVIDTSKELSDRNWSYINKVSIPVKVEDADKLYNVYLNLRHTADYKYSNIYVLVHQVAPDKKRATERREFQLAYPDGEWLGSGSGNLYSYQLPIREKYKFPAPGTYIFEFEQNMRDNPLREVNDVGLRVEPAQ